MTDISSPALPATRPVSGGLAAQATHGSLEMSWGSNPALASTGPIAAAAGKPAKPWSPAGLTIPASDPS